MKCDGFSVPNYFNIPQSERFDFERKGKIGNKMSVWGSKNGHFGSETWKVRVARLSASNEGNIRPVENDTEPLKSNLGDHTTQPLRVKHSYPTWERSRNKLRYPIPDPFWNIAGFLTSEPGIVWWIGGKKQKFGRRWASIFSWGRGVHSSGWGMIWDGDEQMSWGFDGQNEIEVNGEVGYTGGGIMWTNEWRNSDWFPRH